MKKLVFIAVVLCAVLVYGCKESEDTTGKNLVGKWKTVEVDINITDETEKAREEFETIKAEFEQMVLKTKFEFGEDKSFNLISPRESVSGTWRYEKDINAVIVTDKALKGGDLDTFKIEASDKNSMSLYSSMGADGSIRFKIEKEEAKKGE